MSPHDDPSKPVRKSVHPKPVTKEPASPARARYITPALVDIHQLDATRDAEPPNTSVATLTTHAEKVAQSVRTYADELALAKVTAVDADRLDALVALLRERETLWQTSLAKIAPGAVAKLREAVVVGNRELYGALDAFVDDAATQAALGTIPGEDTDDDLDAGTDRLVALARAHAAELAGTEVTPARVQEVADALTRFRGARAGVREREGATTSAQSLGEDARRAQELRNRAFWALAELDRKVCKRAKFRFRNDPRRAALFERYTAKPGKTRKKKTS